ncbi:aromatic ring-hydroxylating oxygenase subunit alpha [Pontixanthobacter aquaemixtae]|uniref:Rieske 2Fe-2S domain-containing protein n=1 Tax=Pontixanthobacter aquaemixtae TaxID=1958940 RepID=A0A844ZQB7_9SPHN|nr:aromatic ring-hydroxylating dioxygenase subunit alpha [Pontixanthobacter aquaemixtae]MXO89938.1 Rieske 2Fe-2S domain-containing protein [Pontixanthobacter aquaemixtae]
MAEADPSKSFDIPYLVENPERIPSKRYYDEEFYKAENERLWPHVWQMATRLEVIENVGDWIEYSNLGRSVIVVRAKDGVKAYHNACRHRGVPIASPGGHGNCKSQGFICPFHGWRWNLDGENTFVYGKHFFSEEQLDHADLALRPCRVETAIGCAFINFDDDAPSLRDSIGPLIDDLEARGMHKQRAEWWYATKLPANWKTAMEAFMEGYHVMRTHPQLQQKLPQLYNTLYGMDTGGIGLPINPNLSVGENVKAQYEHMILLNEGMAGMMHQKEIEIAGQLLEVDLPEDPAEAIPMWYGIVQHQVVEALRARGEDLPDLNAVAVSNPIQAVEFLFPHYFVLPIMSSASAYRIRPLGPEECLFELWSLTNFAESDNHNPVTEPTVLPYDSEDFPTIPRQDYSNIPIQQQGLHAEGFDFMRLGGGVEGLISNYNRVIDGHLTGVESEKLSQATHKLAHNFDGQIHEFEF